METRPLPVMRADPWDHGEHSDDEPCYQAGGPDTKKKTVAASERREGERAKFREQMKEAGAKRLVVVDECGSNIALTLLYTRAPSGAGSLSRHADRCIVGDSRKLSGGSDRLCTRLLRDRYYKPHHVHLLSHCDWRLLRNSWVSHADHGEVGDSTGHRVVRC